MNQKHLQHLYWRAGFSLTPKEWRESKQWSIQKAVDHLFRQAENPSQLVVDSPVAGIEPKMSRSQKEEVLKRERMNVARYSAEWIQRMKNPKEPALLERMSLFWHGYFACDPKLGFLAIQQINVIRTHALGNFKDLLLGIAKDPAMIRYLNNQQNRKGSPNENFAREVLELFTIGRGNYTEQDIKEAARAFTGWSSNLKGEFVFRRFQHDFGQKTFMDKTGNFDGEDIIDIILDRKETALFITRKIYKYFVNEIIDEDIVADIALEFYQSNYNISSLMHKIFTCSWFYSKKNMGTKIKSPTDLLVGLSRQLDLSISDPRVILKLQRGLGQVLFKPPNVAGWQSGKSWIDNSTLLLRLNIPTAIYGTSDIAFQLKPEFEKEKKTQLNKLKASTNVKPLLELARGNNATDTFTNLSNYLIIPDVTLDRGSFKKYIDNSSPEMATTTLGLRLMSLPEYQMC